MGLRHLRRAGFRGSPGARSSHALKCPRSGSLTGVEPLVPSVGWGVVHLFFRVDHTRAEREPGGAKRVLDAIASLEVADHQALCAAVLGHKADLMIMALGPDLARLQAFQR